MESIKNVVNFERKNLLIWIGLMNGKPTAWIGRQNDNATIDYKEGFEDRDLVIKYIIGKIEELSEENISGDNLKEEDILVIQNILERGENKLETKEILKN